MLLHLLLEAIEIVGMSLPYYCLTLVTIVFSLYSLQRERGWRTFKRPGVDAFLEHLAQFYEVVVYSDHLQMVIFVLFFGAYYLLLIWILFMRLTLYLAWTVCRPHS